MAWGQPSDTPLLQEEEEEPIGRRRICGGGTVLCLAIFLLGCVGLTTAIAVSLNLKVGPEDGPKAEEESKKLATPGETLERKDQPTKTLSVMTIMVWGSPGSFGTQDKEARMRAIGGLPQEYPDIDLFLLTDLWMRPDHDTIKSLLPEEYDMTRVTEMSLPSCDGIIAPEFCSGLAVISRHPFLKVKFYPFDNHGDLLWDYEYFLRRGLGKVEIEVMDKTVEVFVSSLASNSYNSWYREKQVKQLLETVALSQAEVILVGGDLNVDPRDDEQVLELIKRSGLSNAGEEYFKGDQSKWLAKELSTLGNEANTYTSREDGAVILDYIFHRGGEVENFKVPILTTEVTENKTVSVSNHEAVVTVIKL